MPKVTFAPLLAVLGLAACATPDFAREPFVPAVTRLAKVGDVKRSIDELATPLIASRRNIGMVIGFATEDEEGLYAYGHQDLDGKVPMTVDQVFQTGSISKAFTSLAVAELAREGKLRIDEPVRRFLPAKLAFASPELKNVTFAELASHTSGMPHESYNKELLWGLITYLIDGDNLYRYLDTQMMSDYLASQSYSTPSAKKYAYSNIGYTYLGWVLHQMEPRGFEHLMREKVFAPLGLSHTGLSLRRSPPQLTPGYAGDLPTFVARHREVPPWLFAEGIAGAGAVYSTAGDLLRFAKINAGLIPSPLKPSLDVTRRPIADAEGGKIGMSWFIKTLPDSREPYTYIAGIIGGYTSFVGFDESRKLAVVVLQNSINHEDYVGVELLDRLVGAYRLKHDGVQPKEGPKPKPDGEPLLSRRVETHYSLK